jgi:hypothetical protein
MEHGTTADQTDATGSGRSGSRRSSGGEDATSPDGPPSVRRRVRAQTTIDFTVGVVLFVFVLIGIFTFVSGTIQPFTTGDQEDIVSVNRVADGLAEDTLGDPDTPYVLDRECTVAFFEGGSPPGDCRFGDRPLEEQVGVGGATFLNVTVRGNVSGSPSPNELLCWDETAEELVEQSETDCSAGDVVSLSVGDDAESGAQSSVTARRAVSVDGSSVSLVVKLW